MQGGELVLVPRSALSKQQKALIPYVPPPQPQPGAARKKMVVRRPRTVPLQASPPIRTAKALKRAQKRKLKRQTKGSNGSLLPARSDPNASIMVDQPRSSMWGQKMQPGNAVQSTLKTVVRRAGPSYDLAQMIVDPGCGTVVPVGTSRRVKVDSQVQIFSVDFNKPAIVRSAGNAFSYGQHFCIIRRDPLWNVINYIPNPDLTPIPYSPLPVNYDIVFDSDSGVQNIFVNWAGTAGVGNASSSVSGPCAISRMTTAPPNSLQPHGPEAFWAQWDSNSYFWIDATQESPAAFIATATTQSGITATSYSITIEAYFLNDDNTVPYFDQAESAFLNPNIGQSVTIPIRINKRGYFCFRWVVAKNAIASAEFIVDVDLSAVLQYQSNSVTPAALQQIDFFGHLPVSGILEFVDSMSTVRVTSMAALIQDVAAEVFQNGNIMMAQMGSDRPWTDFIGTVDLINHLSTTMNAEDYFNGKWANGGYMYAKPDEGASSLMKDTTRMVVSDGHPTDPHAPVTSLKARAANFSPFPVDDYLLVVMAVTTEPGTPAGRAQYSVGTVTQWTPSSPFTSGTRPVMTTRQASDILDRFVNVRQFWCNPEHIPFLSNIVQMVGAGVEFGKGAAGLVSDIGSLF